MPMPSAADQAKEEIASIGRHIFDSDSGADQSLADAQVVREQAAAARIFACSDEERAPEERLRSSELPE
jgi:hypothetical protein